MAEVKKKFTKKQPQQMRESVRRKLDFMRTCGWAFLEVLDIGKDMVLVVRVAKDVVAIDYWWADEVGEYGEFVDVPVMPRINSDLTYRLSRILLAAANVAQKNSGLAGTNP